MRLGSAAALAACSMLACAGGEDVTEIVVVVDSDIPDLQEVVVAVDGLDGQQTAVAQLGPAQPPLPRVLGVVHEGGALGPTTIATFGVRTGDVVAVVQRFEVSFVNAKTRRLDVMLSQSCISVFEGCEDGETCIDGSCEPNGADLAPWSGEP